MSGLAKDLTSILRGSRTWTVLQAARALDLPDWLLFSGAVYQPVWNRLTGRPPDYGVRDYDLAYFDGSDLSWDAEDVVIRRVAAALSPPLHEMVEVRNQARVHLWFEDHFGEPYAPLACSSDALARFAAPAFAVGVRLEADDSLTVFAPFGLEDVFAMRIRPNPGRTAKGLPAITRKAQARWPELTAHFPDLDQP